MTSAVAPPTGRRVRAGVALLVVAAAAVVGGLLWADVTPRLHYLITVIGPFPVSEDVAGKSADADAWFGAIALVLGLLAGVAAVLTVRPSKIVAAPVAAAVATVATFVMFVVGQLSANDRLIWSWKPVAGDNHEVVGPLFVQAWGVAVFAPIAAVAVVLVGSILFPARPDRAAEPEQQVERTVT